MGIKKIIKNAVPPKIYNSVKESFIKLKYFGNNVHCPCCNNSFSTFLPAGIKSRQNAKCPVCRSVERHRMIWLFLKNETSFFRDKLKVLHFAPEPCFIHKFSNLPNLDYLTADLYNPTAMVKMDITNITMPDNTYDVIICNHVLEHIEDDRKAMSELRRVLKPGGWAILQVPLSGNDKTYEDFSITLPKDREREFGQEDHVRIYGFDYKDRLSSVGFKVTIEPYAKKLINNGFVNCQLRDSESVYFCTK